MMHKIGFLLFLGCVLPAWATNTTSTHVVDLGSTKAVPFDETASPDGRYIIGWTIQVRNKAKPVDWSKFDPDNALDFVNTYDDVPGEETDKYDYILVDCVIDLKDKKLLVLPSDESNFPNKNRGYLVAVWGKPEKGRLCALVQNDSRFATANLWLIVIDSKGMSQRDLAPDLDKAVDPLLRDKRPVSYGQFGTTFPLQGNDPPAQDAVLTSSTATFWFSSDIPKEGNGIEGSIKISLPDGKILAATSDTKRDDPFEELPELGKVDKQMNDVYQQLSKKLGPTAKAALKKEQLAWIDERNEAGRTAMENSSDENTYPVRNKAMLDSTQERLEELQQQLRAAH